MTMKQRVRFPRRVKIPVCNRHYLSLTTDLHVCHRPLGTYGPVSSQVFVKCTWGRCVLNQNLEESDTLDLKRDWSGKHKGIEDLAAFANTRGGSVIVGVDDDGTVIGFDPTDSELRVIISEIVDLLGLHPEVHRHSNEDGKRVLELRVRPASSLVVCRGRYLVRVGSTNRNMTTEELAQRSIALSGQTWDALPAGSPFFPNGTSRDLNPEALRRFVQLAHKHLPHASETDAPRRILENLDLVRDNRPTRAALLAFGFRPQDQAVGGRIRIARFMQGRIVDDKTVTGTLIEQLEGALERVRANLQVRFEIGDRAKLENNPNLSLLERLQRREIWDYPLEALREAIVNALIHRDYTQSDDIQIRIEDDHLDIWNPGRLDPDLTFEDLRRAGHRSKRRNPNIAEVFYAIDLVERWGTGTTRIISECNAQNLPEPEFLEESGGFKIVFRKDGLTLERLVSLGLNDRQVKAVLHLKTTGRISSAEYQRLTAASRQTATRDLDELAKLEVIQRVGTTGRGTYYVLNASRTPQTPQERLKNASEKDAS